MSLMYDRGVRLVNVTIAASGSLSDIGLLGPGVTVVGIVMPAAWTAAPVTFQGSTNGTTFQDLYDLGTELSVPVDASRYVQVDGNKFDSLRAIRVRSGPSAAPVVQAASRIITLVVRDRV